MSSFTAADFAKVRKALFIGAHCDDTELRGGPVVRRLIRQGAECIEWTLIDCPRGCPVRDEEGRRSSADMIALREKENRQSAAVLGIKEIKFLHLRPWHLYREDCDLNKFSYDFPDFSSREELSKSIDNAVYTGYPMSIFAFRQPAFRAKFIKMLEDTAPDIIFTNPLNDLHIEHYALSSMVLNSVRASEKLRGTPVLMWRAGGYGASERYLPTHFIEVSAEDLRIANEAASVYKSQFPAALLEDYLTPHCEAYGKLCGKEYALAFTEQYHPGAISVNSTPADYICAEYRYDPTPEVIAL